MRSTEKTSAILFVLMFFRMSLQEDKEQSILDTFYDYFNMFKARNKKKKEKFK